MAQHLYPCDRCPKIGVAHYLSVPNDDGTIRNARVCTACFDAARPGRTRLIVQTPKARRTWKARAG